MTAPAYQLADIPLPSPPPRPQASSSSPRWGPSPEVTPSLSYEATFPDTSYRLSYQSLRSASRQSELGKSGNPRVDDEAELLPKQIGSPSSSKISGFFRSFTTTTVGSTPPQGAPFFANERRRIWRIWRSSWNMYLFFAFGVACAIGHHLYYAALNGKPALDQLQMLRYGMALAFAAKAGLSAAVVLAYRQRVWTTVRKRIMRVAALDSLFAATEDLGALWNWEMIKTAKIAVALAVFVW